jgi:hypothetical protein
MASQLHTQVPTLFETPDILVEVVEQFLWDNCVYGDIPTNIKRWLRVTEKSTGKVVEPCAIEQLSDSLDVHYMDGLRTQIARDPVGWSHVICLIYDLGMVVTPGVRSQPLEKQGYVLERMIPVVSNGHLVFYVVDVGLHEHDYVPRKYIWDIGSQSFIKFAKVT